MTYREILLDLNKITDGFSLEHGAYKVPDKSDVQNAISILNNYYSEVNGKNLDYNNKEADGTDYLIIFSNPIEDNRMNEDLITKRDLEAAKLILKHDTDPRHIKKAQDVIKKYKEQNKEDVDEAIEKHDTLNPKLWDENNELKPEVREKIEEIVQKFDDNLKENDVELDVKDITIIGSNANYNYSPDSDVDIHIIADTSVYPDQEDLAMKVYLAYKSLFNNKYDPTLNGIEAEIYVEPDEVHANSNGVYSLKDGWLKEPEQVDVPDIDPEHVQELIQPFEDRYNDLINSEPSVSDVDKLIDDIYIQRQKSIMKDGEFGDGNICFKEFRNRGYLQNLRDLKVELENKEMSLNDMNEQLLNTYGLNEDCDDHINEGLTAKDLFVGAEFVEPEDGVRIVITDISDDLVTCEHISADGNNSFTLTDPISYVIATLNEYDYVLDENCNKKLEEDIFENDNGMEISFPDPRDTLAVYLEWEGIMGYTDEIYEHALEGYDDLDEYLEYEGILGYTSKIYEIVNGGSAWCSQMEMEDFISVCKALYIDYTMAIDDDDIDEKLEESGDLYLGSKWNNKNDRDRFFRTVPKYKIKNKHTGKSFTAQCGRWDSIDDVKKEYSDDQYEVKLIEDFVIDDKPGTKYKNKNGIVIEVIEPTADGLLQYEVIEDDKILDRRAVKDLKSFARMIDANGYKKLNEDTVKQGDKWVNKGKEGTHGKFRTKKAADDQRKAMFANGYHESLDEGTAFDTMPGYMTPEEIRAFNREKEAKAKAEKDAVRAEKKAAAKERAKAERERQKRIDQREKVNNLSYDSLADMAGLEEDNNDLTKDELLAVLRASMSDEEILKLHKKMFEDLNEDFVISDTPGTKYKNENGVIIEVTDPTANGEIQFYFKKDGKILDCRKVSDLKSLERLINDNGYKKIDEDCDKNLNESHKGYDLIFDRDTGDRRVEYGINWIQFYTDNYEDAVRWVRQLDAAIAGDIDKYGEPSDDPKYYDPENYPGDIQKFAEHEYNFRRPRDILASIPKVDFVDKDDEINEAKSVLNKEATNLDEAIDESDDVGASLADYLGISLEDIDYVGGDTYETPEGDYLVATEEEARKHAEEDIKNSIDDMGLDAFTPTFKEWILDNAIDEDAIDSIIDQEIEYFEEQEDDPETLDYLRGLDTFDKKVSYIKDLYGDSFDIWAKDYIDIDKVADEAISEDGVAHFIAFYDGEEIDLPNNLKAYRLG